MRSQSTRREFLRDSALAGAGLMVAQEAFAQVKNPASPNERIAFGCIGVGGKGDSDTADAGRLGDVVAICDTDDNTLNNAAKKYPKAMKFNDYRVMLDKMGKSIDAVTVSIPDHNHGPAAAMAMHMGKHTFCQKPLVHSLYEARALADLARKMKVATQMGNQGTADSGLRRGAAQLRAGAVGEVKEVHVWTNRPIWPQGMEWPEAKPVPNNLHWDVWLGPAAEHPYGDGIQPFNWRGFWAFGTGALGDMGCHTINMSFMGLDLRNPVSVVAETGGHNQVSYPKWSIVTYEFAATKDRPAVKLFWYDGGKRPSRDIVGRDVPESGSIVIGSKGKLYSGGDYGGGELVDGATEMEVKFPESPGHFEEFIRAAHGGEPAMSNFPDYAGPLTETVLLGNLAVWANGKKIEWDAKRLRAKNAPEVSRIIKPRFRSGYSL